MQVCLGGDPLTSFPLKNNIQYTFIDGIIIVSKGYNQSFVLSLILNNVSIDNLTDVLKKQLKAGRGMNLHVGKINENPKSNFLSYN